MGMFRKKPVQIEAVQFNGKLDGDRVLAAFVAAYRGPSGQEIRLAQDGKLSVPTLEGVMHADKGDWIIKGVKGEFYPCKPDIFEASYEAVPEPKASDGIRRCSDCDAPIGECECN